MRFVLPRFSHPYICNRCDIIIKYRLLKMIYEMEHAYICSPEIVFQYRSDFNFSEEKVARLNMIISLLAMQGQSIHSICFEHEKEIMYSEKAIYDYVGHAFSMSATWTCPVKYGSAKDTKSLNLRRTKVIG